MFDDPHLAARAANHQPLTPLDLLDRTLAVHGARPAVAWRDDLWTWDQFGALIRRMAHWLARQGVGRGDVVSVMLTNRPELLAAHFAVPALGAVLNALNTRLEADETAWILNHAGSRLVICEPATLPQLTAAQVPVHVVPETVDGTQGLNLFRGADAPLDWRAHVGDEWQPIALNYTSGTTGRPKGVVYTHRGACMNALGNVLALGLNTDSRYLWTLPMFHCNGWSHTWAVTAAGGLHVCLDRVDPDLILSEIARHEVTHMSCAPVVLYMMLHAAKAPPPVRVKVATGGAAPTPALLEGMEALGFDLIHLYGLTESYGPATLNDPGRNAPGTIAERAEMLARQGKRHVTASCPRVVDDQGQDVPADGETVGEIVLRGNTLMAGYYRNPEATEAAFAGGMFRTGDLAVIHPDGQIQIRDRAKDVIISGGENLSSLEVENVLHKHPQVLIAAVVAAPHPKWGETPWAFVEVKPGETPDPDGLDTFCRAHLAGFKRPRRYVFGPLPRTATGKIQKFALRDQARAMAAEAGQE